MSPLNLSLPLLLAVLGMGIFTTQAAQFYNDWLTNRFTLYSTQSGPTNNPDHDADVNLVEFAFGTDPQVANGSVSDVIPKFGAVSGTNGLFSVVILERLGHQPGAQIDLLLSSNLSRSNWFRPWWLRGTTNSLSSDPAGSVRETFSTRLPGTNVWFVCPSVQLFDAGVTNAKYFVATNGSDSNKGTNISAPFATLGKAAGLANPGDLIYLRGGVYKSSSTISLSRNGAPAKPIRVRPYPGETVIFDFTGESTGSDGLSISGDCWWIYGL